MGERASVPTQRHVVIVGGGLGGLHAAFALHRQSVRVTLVDRQGPTNHDRRAQPRAIRIRWVVRSSRSGIRACPSAAGVPSISTDETPRVTPRGFSTRISYRAE